MPEEEFVQKFEELMKQVQEKYECLRCGECCFTWEVHGVSGYPKGVKPEREQCKHLIPVRKNEETNQWELTECKIHGTKDYPEECERFVMGFGSCP